MAAVFVGAFTLLAKGPAATVPVVVWGLAIVATAAALSIRSLRYWLYETDLRLLIALHVSRFVGIAFLVYARRGELPEDWGTHAGYGDIAVAMTALLAIAALSFPRRRFPRSVLFWNLFGFAEIISVLARGARYAIEGNGFPEVMSRLPMSLLPTFLVPLIIASHIVIFVRVWRELKIERAANS